MILKVFTVYDSKAGYMTPFFQNSSGLALRAFQNTVNNPETQFCKYPTDFTLMEIAEYNDETGDFKNIAKINLGTALDHKEKPSTPMSLFEKTGTGQ